MAERESSQDVMISLKLPDEMLGDLSFLAEVEDTTVGSQIQTGIQQYIESRVIRTDSYDIFLPPKATRDIELPTEEVIIDAEPSNKLMLFPPNS